MTYFQLYALLTLAVSHLTLLCAYYSFKNFFKLVELAETEAEILAAKERPCYFE